MSLLFGIGVLTALAMVIIWAPAYPEPRHPHMRAMDELAHLRCRSCGAPLDALGCCTGCCAGEDWER